MKQMIFPWITSLENQLLYSPAVKKNEMLIFTQHLVFLLMQSDHFCSVVGAQGSSGNRAIWLFFTGGPLIETQPQGKRQRSYPLTEAHMHPSVDLSPAHQPLMKVHLRCLSSLRSAKLKWCLETPDITEFSCWRRETRRLLITSAPFLWVHPS